MVNQRQRSRLTATFRLGIFVISMMLAGCSDRVKAPIIVGAVVGAAAGGAYAELMWHGNYQSAITATGVLSGALVGASIAKMLDRDRDLLAQVSDQVVARMPDGQSLAWENPESGNSGHVRAVASYQTPVGLSCRDLRSTVVVGETIASGNATACQQADGQWVYLRNDFAG